MSSAARQEGNGKERRKTPRFKVALSVELWAEGQPATETPEVCTTRDVSSKGFYFTSDLPFEQGRRFRFRVPFPRELTGRDSELITGTARCLRIEERFGGQYGVAAVIEKAFALGERLGEQPFS